MRAALHARHYIRVLREAAAFGLRRPEGRPVHDSASLAGPAPAPTRAKRTMKTFSAKPEAVRRDWYLVNAEGKTLGPAGDRARASAARQAQAHLHAARRHGRLHRRDQRREDPRHGPQAQGQDLLPAHGHDRQHEVRAAREDARDASRSAPSRSPSKACCRRTRSGGKCSRNSRLYAATEHPHAAQQPKPLEL